MDKLRATGAGRKPADALNVAKLCLLEIMGKDSAVVKGIDAENEIDERNISVLLLFCF
jgi:hypothetical protein